MDHHGDARLPGARLESHSRGRDENATLDISGLFRIESLKPGSRSTNSLEGHFYGLASSGRWDEGVHWSFDASAAVSTAASALGLGILAKLAFALLTKLKPTSALKHPKRKALMEYIKKNPGATFRELLRATGIHSGTARHHVAILVRSGLVMQQEHKATHRFFENHGKYAENWNEVVLLREPELKRLHDWLVANPGSPQKEILAATGAWGWSRSTTQHRLGRLVEDGLVGIRQQGRLKLHSVANSAPAKAPAVPARAGAVSAA